MAIQTLKRLTAEVANALLSDTLGCRIDRGQGFCQCRRLGLIEMLIFRMVHFQAGFAAPHLAKTTQFGSSLQALLLCLIKMKEAQCDGSAVILNPAD